MVTARPIAMPGDFVEGAFAVRQRWRKTTKTRKKVSDGLEEPCHGGA